MRDAPKKLQVPVPYSGQSRAGGARTRDLMHPMHARCQLRYGPMSERRVPMHHLGHDRTRMGGIARSADTARLHLEYGERTSMRCALTSLSIWLHTCIRTGSGSYQSSLPQNGAGVHTVPAPRSLASCGRRMFAPLRGILLRTPQWPEISDPNAFGCPRSLSASEWSHPKNSTESPSRTSGNAQSVCAS